MNLGVERGRTDGHQPPLSHHAALFLVELLQPLHHGLRLAAILGLAAFVVLDCTVLVALVFEKLKQNLMNKKNLKVDN